MTHDNRSEPAVTREKPTSNEPGDFIWYELLTSDAEAAQRFYASILGWKFADSGQPAMDYRIINAGEHGVGGLMAITKDMANHGARPIWLSYIAVKNVDVTVADIKKRGGSVRMQAMDIPNVGRIAMVADPQGAPFYVMTPQGPHASLAFASDHPRPGHCAWNELQRRPINPRPGSSTASSSAGSRRAKWIWVPWANISSSSTGR